LDRFVDTANARAEAYGGPAAYHIVVAVLDYHVPMTILLYSFFAGLLVTAAAGFTFANLSRSREMVAIVASGVSMYRIAIPVVFVGVVLNMLTIVNQEWVIPDMAEKLIRSKSDLFTTDHENEPVYFSPDGEN